MIENFQKNLNNQIYNISKSISPELGDMNRTLKKANELLSNIKTSYPNSDIPDKAIANYKIKLSYFINIYNKRHRLAVNVQQKLKVIDKIISTLTKTATALNIIVTTLKALPVPTMYTPMGVVMLLSDKLAQAANTIKEIQKFLVIINAAIKFLLVLFNELLANLVKLNVVIEEILALLVSKSKTFTNDFVLEQDADLIEATVIDYNNVLGSYKNYTFVLRINQDPTSFVGEIRQRYAVAMQGGKDVYFSEKSYSLNPNILIEQLKLQIDS